MYVALRPGPYAGCAWDFGGIPLDFLGSYGFGSKSGDAKPVNSAIRSSDPYFLERTLRYFKAVADHLRKQMIYNGGNIIII